MPSAAALPATWHHWYAKLQDPLTLLRTARQGVPAQTAFEVAQAFALPPHELEAVYELSIKTLRSCAKTDRPLSATNSEKTLRLIELHGLGIEVFGRADAFLRWLDKPAHGLDQEVPLSLLATAGGIELVAEELRRIAYGDLS